MFGLLASRWFTFLLRGLVALAVGLLTIGWPLITLATLSLLFASLATFDGLALVVSAARSRADGGHRLLLLAGGLLGTTLGIMTIAIPGLSLLAMSYLIAGWAIGSGVAEATAAWGLRSQRKGEWIWILAGFLSILFGVLVALKPAIGLAYLVFAVAIYAFVSGMALISLALRVRAADVSITPMLDSRSSFARHPHRVRGVETSKGSELVKE